MADPQYDSLQLVGFHEPDASLENGPDGNKVSEPLPGLYSVGVVLGGKFVSFASFKAGNYVDENNQVKVGGGTSSDSSQGDGGDGSGEQPNT
jgi:hypothetical protein